MQGQRLSTSAYWSLDYPTEPIAARDEAEVREELLSLLTDAVRLRMRADVPVGAYLSAVSIHRSSAHWPHPGRRMD